MPEPRILPTRLLRIPVSMILAALVLGACGGSAEDGVAEDTSTAQPTPAKTAEVPETTVEVPEGENITPPGTMLAFGDTATVAHEAKKQGTVLDLTVDSAEQGSLADFTGFDLDDPYKKRGSYFYVRVSVSNSGEEKVGELPVPLWGISGNNTLLQAVEFKSAFKKCPTQSLPKKFAPGDDFKTCLVFLSPNRGTLEGVSYRPTEDYEPIEWRGKVKLLPKRAPKANKDKGKS